MLVMCDRHCRIGFIRHHMMMVTAAFRSRGNGRLLVGAFAVTVMSVVAADYHRSCTVVSRLMMMAMMRRRLGRLTGSRF